MKLTEIANRLREVAAGIESVAIKSDEDDCEFPNDSVTLTPRQGRLASGSDMFTGSTPVL
jgi:hypothetical protein